MFILEDVAGFALLAALIGTVAGLPTSYGVLRRSSDNFHYKKLPLILRLFYTWDYKKDPAKKSTLARYPEIWSFVIVFGIAVYFLVTMFEVDEETDELLVQTQIVWISVAASTGIMLAWIISVFGVEAWLKRRWMHNNRVVEDENVEAESDE